MEWLLLKRHSVQRAQHFMSTRTETLPVKKCQQRNNIYTVQFHELKMRTRKHLLSMNMNYPRVVFINERGDNIVYYYNHVFFILLKLNITHV